MRRLKILGCIALIFLSAITYIRIQKSRFDLLSPTEIGHAHQKLHSLAPEERNDMAAFFLYANFLDHFAYTLIGMKPMSICRYLEATEDLPDSFKKSMADKNYRAYEEKLKRGAQALKKYTHLFNPETFLISTSHASETTGIKQVNLIHKSLCTKIATEHSTPFTSKLDGTPLLDVIGNPDHPLFYTVIENDLLLGTLLGFGINNAKMFHEKLFDVSHFFSDESLWSKKWLLPNFICDPTTDETKALTKKYTKARKHIRWTYFNRDDLEVTIALLMKKPS